MGGPYGLLSPKGERYGVPTFHLQKYVGLGVHFRPGGLWVTRAQQTDAPPTSIAIWLKRRSHFRLLTVTIFNADSTSFTIPTI